MDCYNDTNCLAPSDIDALPELMDAFLDTIFKATGYRGFIGLSGPDAHANNLTTNLT